MFRYAHCFPLRPCLRVIRVGPGAMGRSGEPATMSVLLLVFVRPVVWPWRRQLADVTAPRHSPISHVPVLLVSVLFKMAFDKLAVHASLCMAASPC